MTAFVTAFEVASQRCRFKLGPPRDVTPNEANSSTAGEDCAENSLCVLNHAV
jgi:hypothetical protein